MRQAPVPLTLGALFEPWTARGEARVEHWQSTRPVRGLAVDSRAVAPGYVFFARPGVRGDGIAFVDRALAAGATAVVTGPVNRLTEVRDYGVPTVRVGGIRACLGACADRYFGEPSRRMRVVGVTGTNGKTSVSHCIAQALTELGRRCGIIGTLGQGIYGEPLAVARHTTPDVIELHQRLAEFADAGASHAVMEVSSHGLDQGRVEGVRFDVVVLTNLSRDHLDYHVDEAGYRAAKRRLFESPGIRAAVINADDRFGAELLATVRAATRAYWVGDDAGAETPAAARRATRDVAATVLAEGVSGSRLTVRSAAESATVESALIGRFNAHNLLAALGTLLELEVPVAPAVAALGHARAPAGRMEQVTGPVPGLPRVVVDYAHTPDALRSVLETLKPYVRGELWCVFGCGGDRDRGKRPLMGRIALEGADRVVITSDNPRSESPAAIIEDILAPWRGRPDVRARVLVEPERRAAIRLAVARARAQDVVLIAGKGHEPYQLIGDAVLDLDDREVARSALEERGRC